MGLSDRALRRMVSRLSSMSAADFDGVMETLSNEQRTKIIKLLEELEGGPSKKGALEELTLKNDPLVVPANLSPWLVARVNGSQATGGEVVEEFSMTAHASAALRLCAAELVPQPPAKSSRLSLFGKLRQRLASDRLAT